MTSLENSGIDCEICRRPSIRVCLECDIQYCHTCENQTHWDFCQSFQVFPNENDQGFNVKVTRNVYPGEIIFKEFALTFGPKLCFGETCLACVGCNGIKSTDQIVFCCECLWPMCSVNCNEAQHQIECPFLKLLNTKTKNSVRYDSLLVLRILLLQTQKAKEWTKFCNYIKKTNFLNTGNNDNNAKLFCLSLAEKVPFEDFSEILINNLFSLVQNTYFDHKTLLFIFSQTNLIEHSCLPNCFSTIDFDVCENNYKITIRANKFIEKNNKITMSFVDLFEGTFKRLSKLRSLGKNCNCLRCEDSTELDTNFSALKCMGTKNQSCNGTQLPKEPTNIDTIWVCDCCKIELPNDQMLMFLQHLETEVDKVLKKTREVGELETFLSKLLLFVHSNHFYVCRIKLVLEKEYEEKLIPTKIRICEGLVSVAQTFFPDGGWFLSYLLHNLCGLKMSALQGIETDTSREEVTNLLEENKKYLNSIYDPEVRRYIVQDEALFYNFMKETK